MSTGTATHGSGRRLYRLGKPGVRSIYVLDGCQGSACRQTAGRFLDEILIAVYRGCAFEIEGSQSLWPLTPKC